MNLKMFKQNENNIDRAARIIVGILALGVGLTTAGLIHVLALVIAFLGIFTGVTGFCLIYKILGWNTKK